MADTIARVTATTTWQSVNVLTGLAAGSAIKIQHIGGAFVNVVIAAAIPTTQEGEQIRTQGWFAVAAGESSVWVKTSSPLAGRSASLSVQDNS